MNQSLLEFSFWVADCETRVAIIPEVDDSSIPYWIKITVSISGNIKQESLLLYSDFKNAADLVIPMVEALNKHHKEN